MGRSSLSIWVFPPAHFKIGFAETVAIFLIVCSAKTSTSHSAYIGNVSISHEYFFRNMGSVLSPKKCKRFRAKIFRSGRQTAFCHQYAISATHVVDILSATWVVFVHVYIISVFTISVAHARILFIRPTQAIWSAAFNASLMPWAWAICWMMVSSRSWACWSTSVR